MASDVGFGVVKGELSSFGLSLATFGVVFFLFWCGQGRTFFVGAFFGHFGVVFFLFWCGQGRIFFVGALFDPTISEHAQCPKERPS